MASNPREWSVPAPVRALLWWPGVSFVLVIVAPDTIEGTIVASGVLLTVIGGFVAAAGERLRENRVRAVSPAAAGELAGAGATVAAGTIHPRAGQPTTSPAMADPPPTDVPTLELAPAAHHAA